MAITPISRLCPVVLINGLTVAVAGEAHLKGGGASGFRHVSIKGGTIVANGKPVYCRVMEIIKKQTCVGRKKSSLKSNGRDFGRLEAEAFGPEVLLVHEDLPTGLRAREVLNNLERQIGIKTHFQINLCRFGMLEDSALAEPVLQHAKRADIMFLSLHGDEELPTAIRDWLLLWLEKREFKPCALVVSLDSNFRDSATSHPMLNFLRIITAPLEVDLFVHFGTAPAKNRTMQTDRPVGAKSFWMNQIFPFPRMQPAEAVE